MNIRIVVMGSAFVGKTAIIRRFITGSFPQRYVPTIEDMHRATMNETHLEILDTSGAFEFPAMRELAVATGNAFIIVYETYNEESFETARRLADFVRERRGLTVPVIIVENKVDREVYDNRKKEDVRSQWECEFHRVSARFGTQREISAIFEDAICHEQIARTLKRNPRHHFCRSPSLHILRKRLFSVSSHTAETVKNIKNEKGPRKSRQSGHRSALNPTEKKGAGKSDLRYFLCLS